MKLLTIEDTAGFSEWLPFLIEGYNKTEEIAAHAYEETVEGFIALCWKAVCLDDGSVFIALSEEDEPLGYGVGFNVSNKHSKKKTLLVYGLYSNGKGLKVPSFLLEHAKKFAKEHGYQVITGWNVRFAGGTFRFYEKILGMKRSKIEFRLEGF